MRPVKDPSLLARLEATDAKPVTDPNLLKQLEGPAPAPPPSLIDQAAGAARTVGGSLQQGFNEYRQRVSQRSHEGLDQMSQTAQDPGDLVGAVMSPLNLVSGAFSMAAAPVTAAVDQFVGKPVAALTANAPHGDNYDLRLPENFVGDSALNIGGMFALEPKAPIHAPEGTVYRAFKESPAERRAGAMDRQAAGEPPPPARGPTPVTDPALVAQLEGRPVPAPEAPPIAEARSQPAAPPEAASLPEARAAEPVPAEPAPVAPPEAAPAPAPTIDAVWRSAEGEHPVEVTGPVERAPDGADYVPVRSKIDGSEGYAPAGEVAPVARGVEPAPVEPPLVAPIPEPLPAEPVRAPEAPPAPAAEAPLVPLEQPRAAPPVEAPRVEPAPMAEPPRAAEPPRPVEAAPPVAAEPRPLAAAAEAVPASPRVTAPEAVVPEAMRPAEIAPAPEAIAPPAEVSPPAAPPEAAPLPSSTVAAAPVEERFPVDPAGRVVSDKGGPVQFGTATQAEKWAANVGGKKAPAQQFEIIPAERGYTVREKAAPPAAEPLSAGSPPVAAEPRPLAATAEAAPASPRVTAPETALTHERAPAAEPARPGEAPRQGEPARPAETPHAQAEAAEPVPDRENPRENAAEAKTGEPVPTRQEPAPEAQRKAAEAAEPVPDKEGPTENAAEAKTGEPIDGNELTDEQLQKIHDRMKGGRSVKMYSNPLDPEAIKELLIDPAGKLVRREIDGVKEGVEYLRSLGSVLKGSVSPKALAAGTGAFVRKIWWSNVAAVRVIANKYEGRAAGLVTQLADMIGTDPGRGRVVEQTYERAVQMQAGNRVNALSNILGDRINVDVERKVLNILSGRSRPLLGSREAVLAKRLRKILDDHHAYMVEAGLEPGYVKETYFPRVLDTDAALANPVGFKTAATKLYGAMGLDPTEAAAAADAWYSRVLGIKDGAYASGLPGSKATKGRTLPADAEKYLVDENGKSFYQTSLRNNLAGYFNQSIRAAEFARRFGANGEKAQDLFNEMLRQGVSSKDVQQLRHNFESATGMAWSSRPGVGTEFLGWMQLHGMFKLLPRAVISSVSEGFSAGVRAHNLGKGFQAVIDSYGSLIESALGGKDGPSDAEQVARTMGIVGDAVNDMILQSAFGGGEIAGSGVSGRLRADWSHKFFTMTGLTQLTEAQRVAAVRIGQGFVGELLSDVLGATKRAKSGERLLNELGISKADAPTVDAWLKSGKDGALPVDQLMSADPAAVKYRTAIQRFVDESIQNPTAADKPEMAGHPVGRLAYAITSFMFSFTRNVLIRTARETGEALKPGYTLEDRTRLLAPSLGLGMLTAASLGVNQVRNAVLNQGTTSEQTKPQQFVAAASRASLFGNADPFVNLLVSARYKRDLTSTLTGAYLTSDLADISNLTIGMIPKSLGGPNSPGTNNAEWQAAKSGYQLIAAPTIAAAASLLPGGPAMRAAYGAGTLAAGSPDSARSFADKVAGERTIKPHGASSTAGRGSTTGDTSLSLGDDMKLSLEGP